jgi:hypothetical protein
MKKNKFFHQSMVVKKKRELFPGGLTGVSEFICVTTHLSTIKKNFPGAGILTGFPFDRRLFLSYFFSYFLFFLKKKKKEKKEKN